MSSTKNNSIGAGYVSEHSKAKKIPYNFFGQIYTLNKLMLTSSLEFFLNVILCVVIRH